MTVTAVERFAARHDGGRVPVEGPYSARLPATGEQYAFQVDLDACTGCKACVVACSSMNGLDADESWRSVGLLVGTAAPYQQAVTTGCHHCLDPGCMSGCPVDAYEKDPVTGIVSHLDDQCIGCRYCTLTCPYEVPRFNSRLGIVRKCDMCAPRLAVGEDPACVQGCPTNAISIAIVDATGAAGWTIPESPSPTRTRPTTRYVSARPIPASALPADHFEVRPGHAHTPLAVMLVLSQLAVGAQLAGQRSALVAVLTALAAMAASVAHLGRPHLAWKAVIGLRHSWISREIVALSLFAGVTAVHAVVQLDGGSSLHLHVAAHTSGIAAVGCSVAIYAATGRRWWSARALTLRFGLTVLTATALALVAPIWVVAVTIAKLATEGAVLRHRRRPASELGRTATLLTGDLAATSRRRVLLGVVGGVLLPLLAVVTGEMAPLVPGGLLLVGGELIERSLMFTASAAPRMPGSRR